MIPWTIKQEIQQIPLPISYSSSSHKTHHTNHISTSPHSLYSPIHSKERFLKLKSDQMQHISFKGSLLGQIKISLYNRQCVLDCGEGEQCMRKLQKTLEEWGTSQQTKICLKLLVSHKLYEANPKFQHIFDATVREYEQPFGKME